VGQDQGWPLHPLDDVGHGEGLAAAGDPQQRLMAIAPHKPLDKLLRGLGLVPGRLKVGHDLKGWHDSSSKRSPKDWNF